MILFSDCNIDVVEKYRDVVGKIVLLVQIVDDLSDIYGKKISPDLMTNKITYPTKITDAEKATYLAHPLVAWNAADALKLINTQYWVANIWDPREGLFNWRRSGYPQLERNKANDDFLQNGGDGFVHRYRYNEEEYRRNKANVEAAAAKIGGDYVTTRVFWDKK